jgi:hypothetical protein
MMRESTAQGEGSGLPIPSSIELPRHCRARPTVVRSGDVGRGRHAESCSNANFGEHCPAQTFGSALGNVTNAQSAIAAGGYRHSGVQICEKFSRLGLYFPCRIAASEPGSGKKSFVPNVFDCEGFRGEIPLHCVDISGRTVQLYKPSRLIALAAHRLSPKSVALQVT